MAGAATLNIKLQVTGLGQAETYGVDSEGNPQDITLTVPTEIAKGFAVVSTATTTALQISDLAPHIALTKMYRLYMKAIAGTIYVKLNTAGTTSIDNTTATMKVLVGEPQDIAINEENNAGIVIDAAAVTDSFEFMLLGKA